MDFNEIIANKLYKLYANKKNDCVFIVGKTQQGNDYILRHAYNIFIEAIPDLQLESDKVIWIHGNGPSPHFIFYIHKKTSITFNDIEIAVKSLMPKKSRLNAQLTCCFLKNVILTDIKGLVHVKNIQLKKLLLHIKLAKK